MSEHLADTFLSKSRDLSTLDFKNSKRIHLIFNIRSTEFF